MERKPRFGIYLPSFSRKYGSRDLYDYNLKAAKLVEDSGMDSVWAVDHLHAFDTVEKVGKSFDILESMTLISALAASTNRVLIGTSVLSSAFRSPALLAKMAATVDVISNGRLILGMGAGWRRDEFEGYGFQWEKTAQRLDRTAEAIDLVKEFWTRSVVDHEGEFYKIKGGQLWPKPIQRPRPKIMFGGVGFKAMELAKHTDGWVAPPLNAGDLKQRLSMLEGWGINPIEFDVVYEFFTSVDTNRESAYGRSRESLEKWFGDPLPEILAYDTKVQLPHGISVRYGAVVGSVEDCVEGVVKFAKAGVKHFELHFMPLEDSLDGIKLYSKKVIPLVSEQLE